MEGGLTKRDTPGNGIWEGLHQRLNERQEKGLLRSLRPEPEGLADFCSNDFLGLARRPLPAPVSEQAQRMRSGSGASRLIAGNYALVEELEAYCADLYQAEACTFFHTGFSANVALLSALPTRHDTLLLDEHCHASLADGARLSQAQKRYYRHNDLEQLEGMLSQRGEGQKWVVTETLFSMHATMPDLSAMVALCSKYGAFLILDEAHTTGLYGPGGSGAALAKGASVAGYPGLVRVHTFGKAVGAQGAVVAGPAVVRQAMVNYARPFIYTTGPLPVQCLLVRHNLEEIQANMALVEGFWQKASLLAQALSAESKPLPPSPVFFLHSTQPKQLAETLQKSGIWVRPILPPTVPEGDQGLRITVHAYNTEGEIRRMSQGTRSK
jgi:8-amino-7-oxononanoate synthase